MPRPLRFCMITTFYPPYNFGGDGIFVQRLANALARCGHQVEIIHCIDSYHLAAPPPSPAHEEHPNITLHGLKSPFGRLAPLVTQQTGFPLLHARRIRAILSQGFDVIHYHNISLVGGPGVLTYGSAIKLYTLHEYWLLCPTHALFRFNRAPCAKPSLCALCTLVAKRPPQLWRYAGLMERAIRHVDAFIAPSLTSQRKHEQMGFPGRIEHVPNFVSSDPAAISSAASARRSAAPPYFLFVGRLEKLKGLHTLIPLFLRQSRAELWIAGGGTEEPYLRALAQGSLRIRFLGQQTTEALFPLYRNAVAALYPSVNFQNGLPPASTRAGMGAPLVIMEAFSQKTPVIASNLGSLAAILAQTGGGLVYSSPDELLALVERFLEEPALRHDLGLRAYAAYQANWTVEVHLKRYLALIDQISNLRSASPIAGQKHPA